MPLSQLSPAGVRSPVGRISVSATRDTVPYARADSTYLFYEMRGRGDRVLLIMGLDGTHHGWMAQVPAFRRHFRTITYDNGGSAGREIWASRIPLTRWPGMRSPFSTMWASSGRRS